MPRFFDTSRPRVFAHRGLAVSAPENTLDAFRAAIAAGAGFIETDTQLSRDGIAALFHDDTFVRQSVRIAVKDLTAAQLAAPRTGPGFPVPTLTEALEALPQARFNIDIKSPTVEAAAIAAIRAAHAADRVLIASFSDQRRRRVRAALPGALSSPGQTRIIALMLGSLLRFSPLARWAVRDLDAVQIPIRHAGIPVLTRELLKQCHRVDVEVHIWTVNDPALMRQLLDYGVDGLITDRADLAAQVVTSWLKSAPTTSFSQHL